MNDLPHRHSAQYDAQGNIVLPLDEAVPVAPDPPRESHVPNAPLSHVSAPMRTSRMQKHKESAPERPRTAALSSALQSVQTHTASQANKLLAEGWRQYAWSFSSFRSSVRTLLSSLPAGSGMLWGFLTQPVWIVRPRKEPKRMNRLSLFLLDTVRFGGTFAALFLALFISLNYESFWQIVSSRINPLEQVSGDSPMVDGQGADIRAKLLKSPMLATAGSDGGTLLGYLPPVGPPENRLIIPKLHLNVPIVESPIDALLKEDWAKVEEDIQDALQNGVVHYPGTARPGQAGNFFVTGHSSYYPWSPGKFKTVFARLGDLQPGDDYWIYYGGDKHRYVITSKKEVKPSNVDVLDQPVSKRLGTLMTCTPVGTTLHRLILTADEVDPETGTPMEVGEQPVRQLPKFKMEVLPI